MNFFGHQQGQEYQKSLLFEIIFQARFPDILKIPDETPLDFQSVMRDQGYPNFNINASPVQDIFKPDLGGLTEFLNTYIFASADRNRPYQVNLSKDSISFTHFGSYNKGDEFKNRLNKVLDAFGSTYKFSNFTRIGLRHRNIVNEIYIPNITDEIIKSFIPESIFPELKQTNADEIKSLNRMYTLNDGKIGMNVSYAITTASGIYGQIQLNNQLSYFIDIDCFTEVNIEEIQDVFKFYDLFLQSYCNAFEWSITGGLRDKIV